MTDTAFDDWLNIVYVGAPGTGKSTAALGLARLGKILLFDYEGGMSKRVMRLNGIDPENVVRVTGPTDPLRLEAAIEQLMAKPEGEFVGCVIDSATEWQAGTLAFMKAKNPGLVKPESQGGSNELYQLWTETAKAVYRALRDMPMHTALVALPKRVVDEQGVYYRAELSPAVASFVTSQANTVVQTETKENAHAASGFDYVGLLGSVGTARGKDRLRLVPGGVLANPSADRLVALVRDELDLASDPHELARLRRVNGAQA